MNKVLDRSELEAMVKAGMVHAKAHTIEKAAGVLKLPAQNYYDPAIFDAEVSRIFRRVPLLLAVTAEVPKAGDFKTLDAAGVPVLLTRGQDGEVRAFVNSCSHRERRWPPSPPAMRGASSVPITAGPSPRRES